MTLAFGAIGFYDDYKKLVRKDSRGLAARWKYFWQSVFGLGAALFLYFTADTPAATTLYLPLIKQAHFRCADGGMGALASGSAAPCSSRSPISSSSASRTR